MLALIGGLASAIFINKEIKKNDEEQVIKQSDKEDQNKINVIPNTKLNLFSEETKNINDITQERRNTQSSITDNFGVDVINVNEITLNPVERVKNIEEGNRKYRNYGFDNQIKQKSSFVNEKNFYYLGDDKRSYKKLNKLKKKTKINTLDSANETLPNIHKEQLKTSRIIYN